MLQSNTNLIYYSEACCAGPKLDSRPAYWSTRAVAASQVSQVSTGSLFLCAWCWELAPILGQHSHKAHMHTVRWEVTCWNFLTTLSILPSKQLVLWASSSAKRVAWDISEWSGSQKQWYSCSAMDRKIYKHLHVCCCLASEKHRFGSKMVHVPKACSLIASNCFMEHAPQTPLVAVCLRMHY